MKKNYPIQLKAAFLLLVFALNTMVGFACAIGVDMGFNTNHHHDVTEKIESSIHIHADGKKHIHHEHQSNRSGKSNHHDGVSNLKGSQESPDNCCNDKVLKFEQLDKTIAQGYATVNPVFYATFIAAYYDLDFILFPQRSVSIKYFVRSHHPPIPDIRIAIQSFQI